MKRRLTLALLLPALTGLAQTTLTNDGATLTVEPGATLFVAGAVVNSAAGTLANAGTVALTGDLTNTGTLASAGLLRFAGVANQVFRPGAATVANLTLDNAGAAGQRTLSIPTDLTISGQLVLLNGLLRTAPPGAGTPLATLTLPAGATLTGEAPGRYVQGNLRVERTAVSGSAPVDFGNGFGLNPNGNALGTVRATRTAGLQTAGLSFGQNPARTSQQGIDRIWTVVPDQQPTTPVDLTLTWLPDDDNGLTFGPGQVWRMPDNATAWQAVSSPASAATRTLTVSTAGLSRWTVSNLANPLPVELLRFTAERRGADGLLRWATASEKNSAHFDVESSPDGRTFHRLGTVAGQGSSAQRHDYELTDPNLARYAADVVYYRLRQVDLDGTFSYSPVRPVQVPAGEGFAVQPFPQPFAAELRLLLRTTVAGPVHIAAVDAVGRRLFERVAELARGSTAVLLPEAAALPPGVYVLSITQQQYRRTVKVVRE